MTAEFRELEERLDLSFEPSSLVHWVAWPSRKPSCTMAFSYSAGGIQYCTLNS